MKPIRNFLESIVFAGLKPGGRAAPKPQLMWLGPLRAPMERLLSGGAAPADPLYLSNRTLAQKIKSWSLVAIPCVVLAVGIGVTLSNVLNTPAATPVKQPTAAGIAAKALPNLVKDIKLAPAADVQVIELQVEGWRLVGAVKNNTTREIAVVELVIDLTNMTGSQVGAVKGVVEKLPPLGRKDFQIPIRQTGAAFALIREVTSR